jgi:hypothetical protein
MLFSVLFVPAVAWAGDSPKVREKVAKKACAAGDFRKGVEILADLYVDTDDATFIYNQARCYEQNHQWVSAIDRFREYLRKRTNATSSERAETEKHIAECEALRAQEEAKLAAAASLVPAPQPVASPVPTQPPLPQVGAVAERPAAPGRARGAGLRVAGIVLGSVGVAAAATGLALNLKANSLADEFNKNHSPSTRSSQSSYKTGSIVCYGAGAGTLVAGVVLYLIGHRAGKQVPTQVSLFSLLTPTELSLGLRGAF